MKVFIIMHNRITWPKSMCEWFSAHGHEVILLDNNSSYPPLLDWYKTSCQYKVHRFAENLGHLCLWKSGLIDTFPDKEFIVTDHDLDLSGIPNDWLEVLRKGLYNNPRVTKSGFSLRINDLPQNEYTKKVVEWESKFWSNKDGLGNYIADLDTTTALYSKDRDFGKLPPEGNKFHWAVRSAEPYTADHLPWKNTVESIEASEEEKYYFDNTCTYWAEKFKETMI